MWEWEVWGTGERKREREKDGGRLGKTVGFSGGNQIVCLGLIKFENSTGYSKGQLNIHI